MTQSTPAFRNAKKTSELVALVSDDPKKLATLGRRYGAPIRTDYDGYDDLLRSGDVDAADVPRRRVPAVA